MLARVLPSLQRPWSERVAFLASLAKRHSILCDQLWEEDDKTGPGWKEDAKIRATGLPNALLLLEEERRMAQAGDSE